MKLDEFIPTYEDIRNGNQRVLWDKGWLIRNHHDLPGDKFGNNHNYKLPEPFTFKYKGKKASRLILLVDDEDNVEAFEVHYGNATTNGYAFKLEMKDAYAAQDVTSFYR